MGQSGNVPGAILAADIPEALQTLHDGLAKLSNTESDVDASAADSSWDDSGDDAPVALNTRAGPLISLLQAAADANENVLWDK